MDRKTLIGSDHRPTVGQGHHSRSSQIDHRLDRQHHPGLKLDPLPAVPEIRDQRVFVQFLPHPVAEEIAHD